MTFASRLFSAFLVCSLPFLFIAPAKGQPLYPLLETLVEEHDLIQARKAREQAASFDLRQAEGERYPHLEGVAEVGREHVDPPGELPSSDLNRTHGSLRASQHLFDFGKRRARIDQARTGLDLAGEQLTATRQDLLLQGISAYLNVYRHAERLRLAQESERRIQDLSMLEEAMVAREAGLASDVLQARSQLSAARSLRVQAEGRLNNALSRFQAVFGFKLEQEEIEKMVRPPSPVDDLPVTLERALGLAMDNSVELSIAERNVQMAEFERNFRRADYYPDLQLVGETTRERNDGGARGTRTEALGMVQLTWEIFSGGRKRAAVREAGHEITAHIREKDDLENLIQEEVEVAWENLRTARKNAVYLQEQADILEEFLELAKRERRLGIRSLLDVLNGEVNHLSATSEAISADIEQDLAIYNMLYAMGLLELDTVR